MKKVLAILLAAAVACSFAVINAFAQSEDVVVTVDGKASDAYVDSVRNVAVENDGTKLVVTTTDADDPWVSIALEEIKNVESFTVKYSASAPLAKNQVYLKDDEVNPEYSANAGTWTPPGMDGKTERTFSMAGEFATMVGTTLIGIRFPGGANADDVLTIESISFKTAEGEITLPAVLSASRDQITVEDADRAKFGGNDPETNVNLAGDVGKELRIFGWITTRVAIQSFGYKINGGEYVTKDEFKVEPGQDVIDAAGDVTDVSRFSVTLPITDGSYKIEVVVKTEEGEETFWTVYATTSSDGGGSGQTTPATGDVTTAAFAAVVALAIAAAVVFTKRKAVK